MIERVAFLEQQLKASQLALENTKTQLENTKEKMAREEFEFASTIQRLEEDAQLAQTSLNDASLGNLPAIPFVEEMEKRNLRYQSSRCPESLQATSTLFLRLRDRYSCCCCSCSCYSPTCFCCANRRGP